LRRALGTLVLLLLAATALAHDGLAASARSPLRLLYSSDWLGPTQIFAVDPAHKKPLGQVTFQHLPPCSAGLYPITCGLIDPIPAPDGRHILFRSNGVDQSALWVANADGTNAHVIVPNLPFADPGPGHASVAWWANSRRIRYGDTAFRIDGSSASCCRGAWQRSEREFQGYDESIVSPNGRWVAFSKNGRIGVANRRTNRTRLQTDQIGFNLAWSPDSKSLAYISGFMHVGTSSTGDLRVLTLAGKVRTIVARSSPYGGEIVSVAWARPPVKVRYRKPTLTDGIYAGGEVTRLAADGSRVAFAECDGVYAWTPRAAPAPVSVNPFGSSLCFPPTDRVAVTDLGVAGDRIAYVRSGGGLTPPLELWASSLSNPAPVVLARSGTTVGSHVRGVGTLAGEGALLVYSTWEGRPDWSNSRNTIVTTQSIYRVDSTACPCPALASVPALGEPVDVDDGRIVVAHAFWPDATSVSRTPFLSVLDRNGTELLSLPIDAAAAQLAGRDLVAAVGNSLVDFDSITGQRLHSWPVSSENPARDCLFWAGPDCFGLVYAEPPHYVLQDAARGIAAYTLDGKLHVLLLADCEDSVVSYASEARFVDDGLVYSDGSRIHVAPFSQLFR
jgi:hypothetical protein